MAEQTTTKGVPYVDAADQVSVYPGRMQDLANWIDAHAVQNMSTATRNALAGADLWGGRCIWNTDNNRLEVYVPGIPGWRGVVSISAMTSAARTALAGAELWAGRLVWDTSRQALYYYDGAAWNVTGGLPTYYKTFMYL